jgi:hypothetical protein
VLLVETDVLKKCAAFISTVQEIDTDVITMRMRLYYIWRLQKIELIITK